MISPLRLMYLGLAVWGAVHPMIWFVRQMRDGGVSALTGSWFASAGATGLAWDLIVAAVALILWIVAETRVRRNWSALIAIPVTLMIGVGCGLPLYLFLRTRPT